MQGNFAANKLEMREFDGKSICIFHNFQNENAKNQWSKTRNKIVLVLV